MNVKRLVTLAALCAAILAPSASALSLGTAPGRVAELDPATLGATGTGNATAATLDGISFGGQTGWQEVGEATSGLPTGSGSLSVLLTSGSWGDSPVAGNWSITDANFWMNFSYVAISMHVGNGGGDPDHFIFLIEELATSGTFSYTRGNTGGGGFSNIKLYGIEGERERVPDTGTTAALLGLGLIGLAALRRRR